MQNTDAKCIGTLKQTNPKEENVVECMQDMFQLYKNEGLILKKIAAFSEEISQFEIGVFQTFKWIEAKKEDEKKASQKVIEEKKTAEANFGTDQSVNKATQQVVNNQANQTTNNIVNSNQ